MLCACEIIILAFGIAMASAFVIQVLEKQGWRERLIMKSKYRIVAKMLECDFCLGFWISVVISVISAILFQNVLIILAPVVSAPIIRRIL